MQRAIFEMKRRLSSIHPRAPALCWGFSLLSLPLHFTSLNPSRNVSARATARRSEEEEAAAGASCRLAAGHRRGSAGVDRRARTRVRLERTVGSFFFFSFFPKGLSTLLRALSMFLSTARLFNMLHAVFASPLSIRGAARPHITGELSGAALCPLQISAAIGI